MNNLNNIQALAPFLADDFVDLDEPVVDTEKYGQFLLQKKNIIGPFSKYLICKLHDSWVIETNLNDDEFVVTLNDFATHVFADAIVDKFSLLVDHDKLIFPLTLIFSSDLVVSYNTVDDDGYLHVVPPLKLDEYLSEQVITADTDKIEVVFHFWKSNGDEPGESVIVTVSAKNISLTETQDSAWSRLFGNKYDRYYNYFKQQFGNGRYLSDHQVCLNLINELDASTTH